MKTWLVVMAHSTQAETRQVDLLVQSQPGLHSEFQDYIVRPYLEGEKKIFKTNKAVETKRPA